VNDNETHYHHRFRCSCSGFSARTETNQELRRLPSSRQQQRVYAGTPISPPARCRPRGGSTQAVGPRATAFRSWPRARARPGLNAADTDVAGCCDGGDYGRGLPRCQVESTARTVRRQLCVNAAPV